MAAKLTRLTHKIAIQLHLVAESCTTRRRVWKLLDTPLYGGYISALINVFDCSLYCTLEETQ